MSGMYISMKKIAELAGVSKTTVSRVINNRPDVNPQAREKVEKIIQESGYYPNSIAQAFSCQKNMSIGLVFTHDEAATLSNPYYAELIQGILRKARDTNYHIILTYLLNDDCFRLVYQKAVDGLLILTPDSSHKEKLRELMKLGCPLVSTAKVPGLNTLHFVAVDEYGATLKIIEHLIALGHRNFGYISGPKSLYSAQARLRAYKDALQKNGLPFDPDLMAYGDTSVESGATIMKELLQKGKTMTAVFAGSDMMAIGAKHSIEEAGMRVPDDISLVSTDATDISQCLDVALTTTKQPTLLRGELAMKMLVDIIEGRETPKNIMLPMDIAIRKTTSITTKRK